MENITDIRKLPELGEDSVHIWGVHVPEVLDQLDALHGVLCDKEQKKAARYLRDPDRLSSIAARGALRILLSGYTRYSPSEVSFHYSKNGKPYMNDSEIDFKVSHSADWVVLAFGRNRNIGVDVEKIKRSLDVEAIADRYFAPEEVALIKKSADRYALFFQIWARKEAYVKACSSTLLREIGSFSVPIAGEKLPDIGGKDGWFFHRLEAGSNYAAAVVTDKKLARVPCYNFGGLKWDS